MKDILLNNFLRISKIPRKSGNEEKIANFFIEVAKKNKLEYRRDKHNNVFIRKKGNIQSQSIALQAHLDMVCVKKNNSMHNFETDGIEVIINGDEVTAKDTTLGADQGVGLAMMLTIMEDNNLKHPDIEFILTTSPLYSSISILSSTENGFVTLIYSPQKKLNIKSLKAIVKAA